MRATKPGSAYPKFLQDLFIAAGCENATEFSRKLNVPKSSIHSWNRTGSMSSRSREEILDKIARLKKSGSTATGKRHGETGIEGGVDYTRSLIVTHDQYGPKVRYMAEVARTSEGFSAGEFCHLLSVQIRGTEAMRELMANARGEIRTSTGAVEKLVKNPAKVVLDDSETETVGEALDRMFTTIKGMNYALNLLKTTVEAHGNRVDDLANRLTELAGKMDKPVTVIRRQPEREGDEAPGVQ